MQKVDKPKKPLLVYYLIALVAIILVNQVLFPAMVKQEVKEVDYGTFLTMLSDKTVAKVELSGDEIYFEDKSDNLYSTNTFEDTDLVNRLQEAGCEFGQVKQQEMSPLLSMILSLVIPLVFFLVIGQLLSRSLTKKMGGAGLGNAMSFGKSNAKIYVASRDRVSSSMTSPVRTRRRKHLQEIVDFLHNPKKYQRYRRNHAEGRSSRRPSRNRQDPACQGCCR